LLAAETLRVGHSDAESEENARANQGANNFVNHFRAPQFEPIL
jgi:hypothetical protein